ncbi:hypothetical protein ABT282_24695 [Streptomyces sp. NPDC000927]|uniref:hypothetical protein n=1 Tax=Streptomyces sp. NPDC000927 TaxID=3154371 RepID=UPI0033227BBD
MSGAMTVRTVIDGIERTRDDIRRWELERSRAALTLLKDRLGDERMRELPAPDLRAADRAMAPLPEASGGAWRFRRDRDGVRGGSTPTGSWPGQGKLASGDRTALLTADPEHYLADPSDGVVEIVETIGSGPLRRFLAFHEGLPTEGEGYGTHPVRIGGTGRLADGTEAVRVMHEFRDGPRGLCVRLTIQFPASAPEHVFTGRQWHFACEFLNRAEAAHAATGATAAARPRDPRGLAPP